MAAPTTMQEALVQQSETIQDKSAKEWLAKLARWRLSYEEIAEKTGIHREVLSSGFLGQQQKEALILFGEQVEQEILVRGQSALETLQEYHKQKLGGKTKQSFYDWVSEKIGNIRADTVRKWMDGINSPANYLEDLEKLASDIDKETHASPEGNILDILSKYNPEQAIEIFDRVGQKLRQQRMAKAQINLLLVSETQWFALDQKTRSRLYAFFSNNEVFSSEIEEICTILTKAGHPVQVDSIFAPLPN